MIHVEFFIIPSKLSSSFLFTTQLTTCILLLLIERVLDTNNYSMQYNWTSLRYN